MNPPGSLTIWLTRPDKRSVGVLNPDRRYVGEFLIDSPLGRTMLCACLLAFDKAGYKIARYGGPKTGQPVDPHDPEKDLR